MSKIITQGSWEIISNRGHFDVYSESGELICSCDSIKECNEEMEYMMKETVVTVA